MIYYLIFALTTAIVMYLYNVLPVIYALRKLEKPNVCKESPVMLSVYCLLITFVLAPISLFYIINSQLAENFREHIAEAWLRLDNN